MYPKTQKIAYNEGNNGFDKNSSTDTGKLSFGASVMNQWIQQLSEHDTEMYDTIIKSGSTLSAMFLLSNFGYTLSPFNKYPSDLNKLVFGTPSAVEVPTYLPLYVGALVDAIEGGWEDDILKFFTGTTGDNGIGSSFGNSGYYVLADLHDVKKYLSVKDKDVFRQAFLDYYGEGYPLLLARLQQLYPEVNNNISKYKNSNEYYENILLQFDKITTNKLC